MIKQLTEKEMEDYLKDSKKVGLMSKVIMFFITYGIISLLLSAIVGGLLLCGAIIKFSWSYLF